MSDEQYNIYQPPIPFQSLSHILSIYPHPALGTILAFFKYSTNMSYYINYFLFILTISLEDIYYCQYFLDEENLGSRS